MPHRDSLPIWPMNKTVAYAHRDSLPIWPMNKTVGNRNDKVDKPGQMGPSNAPEGGGMRDYAGRAHRRTILSLWSLA